MSSTQKYNTRAVARALLFEVITQRPTVWSAPALIERIVANAKDKREVETAEKALNKLRRSDLITVDADELVKPTKAALDADDLFGST